MLNGKSEHGFANVLAMCNNGMIQHRSNHVLTVFVCSYSHTTMEKHLEKILLSGTWREPVDIIICLCIGVTTFNMCLFDARQVRFSSFVTSDPVLINIIIIIIIIIWSLITHFRRNNELQCVYIQSQI